MRTKNSSKSQTNLVCGSWRAKKKGSTVPALSRALLKHKTSKRKMKILGSISCFVKSRLKTWYSVCSAIMEITRIIFPSPPSTADLRARNFSQRKRKLFPFTNRFWNQNKHNHTQVQHIKTRQSGQHKFSFTHYTFFCCYTIPNSCFTKRIRNVY